MPETTINRMAPVDPARVRAKQEHIVVRLGDELDKLIKIGSFLREALQNEMTEGMGYKKLAALPDIIRKYKDLASTIESVVSAKVRFDKAAKAMAESMTPAEEFNAVLSYVKSLSPYDRKAFMFKVREWENTTIDVPDTEAPRDSDKTS